MSYFSKNCRIREFNIWIVKLNITYILSNAVFLGEVKYMGFPKKIKFSQNFFIE